MCGLGWHKTSQATGTTSTNDSNPPFEGEGGDPWPDWDLEVSPPQVSATPDAELAAAGGHTATDVQPQTPATPSTSESLQPIAVTTRRSARNCPPPDYYSHYLQIKEGGM